MAEREPQAWTIKGGKVGEYEADSLERGIALLGFEEVADLTPASTRDAIKDLVRAAYPKKNNHQHNNITNQLFAFRMRIAVGDIIAMPLKSIPGFVAVGRVLGEYQYQLVDIEDKPRHVRSVKWRKPHVDKSDIGADLQNSLSTMMTVSHPRAQDSNQRLVAIYKDGNEPRLDDDEAETDDIDSYIVAQDPEGAILDRIHTQFPGRELERLVAAILDAEGYFVLQSPKGADQGVDVLAGSGPMGFDSPRIAVQVKHTTARVDAPTVQQLQGAMTQFCADSSLFVSWSGYTTEAEKRARSDFFTMRLWDARDLLNAIYRNYDRLPDEIRAQIPLQQVWTLVPDDDL